MKKTSFIQATITVSLPHGDITNLETFILYDTFLFDVIDEEDYYFDELIRDYFDYWNSKTYLAMGDKKEYSTNEISKHLESLEQWLEAKEQECWNLELVLGGSK